MSDFGSLADIARRQAHVRFAPKSGHQSDIKSCPLSAISRHRKSFGPCPLCLRKADINGNEEAPHADLKLTSLKSIATINISMIGRRSGPRV